MAATASAALKLAISQRGVHEDPPNSNHVKYATWFGVTGPWCAMFLSWVWYSIGLRFKGAQTPKGWASAELMHQYFVKKGWMVSDPRPGDVVFWHFDGSHAGANHVSLVVSFPSKTTVRDLGGNTGGSDPRDGGMVDYAVRGRGSVIGYGRPPYAAEGAPAAAPAPARPAKWWTRTLLLTSPHMTGADVLACTKRLVAAGLLKSASSEFTPAVDIAVRTFQRGHGLRVDGQVGPATGHAMGG